MNYSNQAAIIVDGKRVSGKFPDHALGPVKSLAVAQKVSFRKITPRSAAQIKGHPQRFA
jgi:hypothetical protein